MKKLASLFLLIFVFSTTAQAQKWGYFNSEFVLSKMPEYQQAQAEFDQLAQGWMEEINAMNEEVERMRSEYRAEEILLTDEMKKERLAAIEEKASAAREEQKKIFGFEGLMFLKRQELIKPVQDQVFEAVEKVCRSKRLQMMIDKSSDGMALVYTDPRHDYTDYVLEQLGLGDPNDVIDNERYQNK
ncbi:outer membrane protein [Catalinimonas alkaloidigena]|uniref:Outer membrane protein n=1 Tax=Catalinimonas alkaloidigena TaxID=1075417 RepID=A0A1G9DV90_9BACT|nr:OmpH family outer membrane protein [Catalinimonas alkaloidigena]SDK67776.1 outer membrane protein [Catalinimonas alkaloidigena]